MKKKINIRYVGEPQEILSIPRTAFSSVLHYSQPRKMFNHRMDIAAVQRAAFLFNFIITEPQRYLIETNLC